jgi:hypothetical protein
LLGNAIERASADVESHALRGNRYTADELADLATDDDWTLKAIVADLAIGHLFSRRGGDMPPSIEARVERSRQDLVDLRDGREIFNSNPHIAAGRAKIVAIPETTRSRLGLVADQEYFPRRQTRIY